MSKPANVSVDYFGEEFPQLQRPWIISESDTGNIVKSYENESDCMFDYAALRNGETTIDQVKRVTQNVI